MDANDGYLELVQALKDRYAPRIVAVLNRVRNRLIEAGIPCDEVEDMSTDDYRWSFEASPPGRNKVGIDLEITEAVSYGDEREDGKPGISFALRIVEHGGRILGDFSPYNYTPEVWVDATDNQAVRERFRLFEQVDLDQLSALVLSANPTTPEAR